MPENIAWLLVIVGGPALLLVLLAWALVTGRRPGRRERAVRDEATRQLYDRDQPPAPRK